MRVCDYCGAAMDETLPCYQATCPGNHPVCRRCVEREGRRVDTDPPTGPFLILGRCPWDVPAEERAFYVLRRI